jgi:hypothetical protein
VALCVAARGQELASAIDAAQPPPVHGLAGEHLPRHGNSQLPTRSEDDGRALQCLTDQVADSLGGRLSRFAVRAGELIGQVDVGAVGVQGGAVDTDVEPLARPSGCHPTGDRVSSQSVMSSSMPRLQPGHHGHAGAAGVLQLEAGAEAVGPRGEDLAVAGSPLDGAARVRLTAARPPPMKMCPCPGRPS